MPRYSQPSLFNVTFLPRKKVPKRARIVKVNKEVFKTGRARQPPLGISIFGRHAATSKVARKRKAS